MSLATLVAAGPPITRKGPGCSVGLALALLSDSEADALLSMLTGKAWKSSQIADELHAEHQVEIKGETIARHRRGGCSCESR